MKKTLEYLVKQLVKNSNDVEVTEEEGEGYLNLKLAVNKDDIGTVIGKGGRVVRALKNLLRIRGIKEKKRVYIEVGESQN